MSRRLGYAAVVAAAVLWAVGGTVARRLTDGGVVVVELVASRAWIGLAGLALLVAARRSSKRGRVATRRIVPAVLLFGIALASANFTYYFSVSRLPVAVAIVIQYSAPALVVLWVSAAERKPPSARVWLAVVVALAGVAMLAELHVVAGSGRLSLDGLGVAAAVASAFAFAAYMVSGERVAAALGADRGMLAAFGIASVVWLGFSAVRGVPRSILEPRFVPGVLFLGVFGTLVPFVLFLWGLGRVQASRAGVVSTLEPLTAALLAWVWLGQSLSVSQLAGAALVVAGVVTVQTERVAVAEVPSPD